MNFSSAHLGLMIIRAGHDPTEHPHLLCKLVRICALLCKKFPHFLLLILSHDYNLIMQMLILMENYRLSWSSLSLKMGVVVFLFVWAG